MGVALQQVIPGLINRKVNKRLFEHNFFGKMGVYILYKISQVTSYFELVKPLIEFKFEEIVTR